MYSPSSSHDPATQLYEATHALSASRDISIVIPREWNSQAKETKIVSFRRFLTPSTSHSLLTLWQNVSVSCPPGSNQYSIARVSCLLKGALHNVPTVGYDA